MVVDEEWRNSFQTLVQPFLLPLVYSSNCPLAHCHGRRGASSSTAHTDADIWPTVPAGHPSCCQVLPSLERKKNWGGRYLVNLSYSIWLSI